MSHAGAHGFQDGALEHNRRNPADRVETGSRSDACEGDRLGACRSGRDEPHLPWG